MSEAEQIYFNPWDEAFRANPYPYYKPLMTGPPRLLNVFLPMALVARYADCAAVLRDHEHFPACPRARRSSKSASASSATRRAWCFPIRRSTPGSAGW